MDLGFINTQVSSIVEVEERGLISDHEKEWYLSILMKFAALELSKQTESVLAKAIEKWFSGEERPSGIRLLEREIVEKGGVKYLKTAFNHISNIVAEIIARYSEFIEEPTTLLNVLEPAGSVILFCNMYFSLASREA